MTVASKVQVLAAIKAAQYEAIIAKGGTLSPGDWGAYAAAIAALPTGGSDVPAIIANMPFTAGAEPLGGTVWYVRPGGAGDRDGRDWDNAFATRQGAVNAASSGDQVRVWEGTYYLEQVQTPKAGVSEYYGFNDDGTWATRQPFTHPSKLDAGFTANNFNNASYVFLDGQVIDGVWFQNATTGGGMVLTQRTHLKNCTINNNSKGGVGGGVSASSGSTLTNCVICNNTGSGGGGVSASIGSTLTNCVICNNTGTGGGGVSASSGSTLTNCVICNNTGTDGGGVSVTSGSNTIINCVICNNTGTNGGGAYLGNGTINNIINCVVCNNTGTVGGGVYSGWNSGYYNVTAINNTAPTGANLLATGNSRIIYNCVSWGGDIYLAQANYAYKIYNCASNFALTGVANWGTIADVQNFLTLTDFPFDSPGVAPYDGSGAFFGSATIGRTEEALAFINRVILPRVTDAHLPAGSPLIGAGYYEAGVTPASDADGKERPITPSIGAYEP